MELEARPVPTLEELKAMYIPRDFQLDNIYREFRNIIPLTYSEVNEMLQFDPPRVKTSSLIETIKDAYVTAKFLRTKFSDTYPKEAWAEDMRRPGKHFQNRSVTRLFIEKEFGTIIERYHELFSDSTGIVVR